MKTSRKAIKRKQKRNEYIMVGRRLSQGGHPLRHRTGAWDAGWCQLASEAPCRTQSFSSLQW